MYYYTPKKESFLFPSSVHYNLKLKNLEILKLSLSLDLQLIPGDIIYITGIIIDEMMMLFDIGIKDNRTFPNRLHPKKPFFDKQVQCIVYGGSRNCGAIFSSMGKDIIRRGMCFAFQYIFNNRNSLRSGLNITLPQDRDSIFHRIRIISILDNVKVKVAKINAKNTAA